LQLSGNNFSSPNDRVGYGIPDAKKAFVILQKAGYTQQSALNNCTAQLQFSVKTDNTMSIVIERKLATEPDYTAVTTLQNSSAWGQHDFSYNDNVIGSALDEIKYRIKMVISTDTTFYLDSMSVILTQNCAGPAENNVIISQDIDNAENVYVTVTRATASKVSIVIQNALGQKVYSNSFQQAIGTQVQTLNLKQLISSRGVYFVSVYFDNKKVKTKEVLRP
jgi:hypothetical protein